MRNSFLLLVLLVSGCGGSETPVSPSPPSSTVSVLVRVTDTLTGTPVGMLTEAAATLPAQLTVRWPGYVSRETWATAREMTVDLFPEAGFDLGFYRQFARGQLQIGELRPLRLLAQSPSFYLQTAGLTPANVSALEAAARMAVPAFTGGKRQVVTWEAATEGRDKRPGWITVEIVRGESLPCGEAEIGSVAGKMTLNLFPGCAGGGYAINPGVFVHEIGHALGFWHVDRPESAMSPNIQRPVSVPDIDRRHGAMAYSRVSGNRDVDADPRP